MKKVILSVILVGVMISCSNNGKKVTTQKAEDVELVKTSKTIHFNTITEDSYIDWRASHLGGVSPRFGKIYYKTASVLVNDGELSNVTILINMSSLTVESFPKGAEEIGKLTGHLKSADFFNVAKYPISKFELTQAEGISGKFNTKLTGNLTIKDITKSITFHANVLVTDYEVSIMSEDFSVNRLDWGLSYNVEGTKGVPVDYIISNDVGFTIHTTFKK